MEPARLTYTDDGRPLVAVIDESSFLIGRSPSNNVTLSGSDVSRDHAEIRWMDERFVVRDRHSRRGTFVNGERVDECVLQAGDKIRVGSTELVFLLGAQQEEPFRSTSSKPAITSLRHTATVFEGLRALGSARVLLPGDDMTALVLRYTGC